MLARFPLLVLAVAALLAAPAAAFAQQTSPSRVAPAAAPAGPRLDQTAIAMRSHAAAAADSAALVPQQRQAMGKPIAMMVVGGAAVILGALIGDVPGTLFMIGGAVAFLYGLYQYIK